MGASVTRRRQTTGVYIAQSTICCLLLMSLRQRTPNEPAQMQQLLEFFVRSVEHPTAEIHALSSPCTLSAPNYFARGIDRRLSADRQRTGRPRDLQVKRETRRRGAHCPRPHGRAAHCR